MVISTDAGGGQIVSPSAETRFYDDLGCLAADWTRHRGGGVRAFVRLVNGTWSDAADASYARPDGARTPMGSGFAAYATIAEARQADPDGRALTFDEVVRMTGGGR